MGETKRHTLLSPASLTGKALCYLINQWDKLIRYCEDGRIDNDAAERAIRSFVIRRRNWPFSDTAFGAEGQFQSYGLIETTKVHEQEPYRYLH